MVFCYSNLDRLRQAVVDFFSLIEIISLGSNLRNTTTELRSQRSFLWKLTRNMILEVFTSVPALYNAINLEISNR